MLGDVMKRRIARGSLILAAGALALFGAGAAMADTSLRVVGPIPGNGSPPEPMELQHALEVAYDGTGLGRAYVQHGQPGGCVGCPDGETSYTFRFLFDPNSISMDHNKRHQMFQAFRDEATNRRVISATYRLETLPNPDRHFLRVKTRDDAGNQFNTDWHEIPDTVSTIEVAWAQSSGVNTNDGTMSFFLDGVLQETVSGLDNDTMVVDFFRMGCVGGVDVNTVGTHYFDLFESFR